MKQQLLQHQQNCYKNLIISSNKKHVGLTNNNCRINPTYSAYMYLMFYIPIVTKRVWAIITNMLSLVWLKISIILYLYI